MFSRRLKQGYFVLEGLNSFATVVYCYYFYFYMHEVFGFGNKANLVLAALNGATYAATAWYGGRFAQRHGHFTALKLGFTVMAAALAAGAWVASSTSQVLVMIAIIAGMSFTWPTLEAMVSENEDRAGVQHMLGVYNVVWAATGAIGYFVGGAILQHWGLKCLFYVPLATLLIQLALTFWLEGRARRAGPAVPRAAPATVSASTQPSAPRPALAGSFVRMAWMANPFAYIATNCLLAFMPGLAGRLGLSTMMAGFTCSIWCFARLASFWLLWVWPGWHYRFRWLLAAYLALLGSFVVILSVPNLALLIFAQLFLGWAIGLLYHSSLYYSMDNSDTKGEHGGIHETIIGLGNFTGPAVGAASLHFLPQFANSGTVAVSLLLLGGLGGITTIWYQGVHRLRRQHAR